MTESTATCLGHVNCAITPLWLHFPKSSPYLRVGNTYPALEMNLAQKSQQTHHGISFKGSKFGKIASQLRRVKIETLKFKGI